ncbi:hypothetical protein BRC97_05645 [Halobacteriales archaeon QS_6_71_20]|nr:MAG: hypothetical protein BRC97_05645 [Halobacteriales archaeon QS_6_71_20]
MTDLPAAPVPLATGRLDRGELVRARVATAFADPLAAALDDGLSGYLRVEPGEALLGGDGAAAVITLDDGVPVLAYDGSGDADGPAALAALSGAEPARVESYRLPDRALASLHGADADDADPVAPFRVAPDAPARELADADALAARTREAADDDRRRPGGDHGALAAFLADEERVEAVRAEARAEAEARAAEWGLTDHLEE